MSMIVFIPAPLRDGDARIYFLHWLTNLPISTHERRRVYFDWLDYNHLHYTPNEIDSLRTRKELVDAGYPE